MNKLFNIRTVSAGAVVALVVALFAPLSAQATTGATFVATPASGSTVSVGDSANLETTLRLPANSTLDSSMEQVWPDGQARLGTVQAPTGWGLSYKVGSSWTTTRPTEPSAISGVRASVTGLQTGPGTANGLQATASATSTVIVADASSINASGRGDGWDVFLSPLYILNVYHHDANYKLECHERATGNLCNPTAVYQVNGYATSQGSSGTYYRGKVYSYVTNGGQAKIICTNVASLPFTPCGTFTVGAAATSATSHLGTQAFDGTRIWAANSNTASLMCFDVTTETACGPYALPGYVRSSAAIAAFTTFIGGKLFTVSGTNLYCTEPSTGAACTGAWPATVANGANQANAIPKRTTAGVVNGVCTITIDLACFDLAGASVAMPAALTTLLSSTATQVTGGTGYFQTTAWTTTRQYWPTNPTATDWTTGYASCYDWVTNAACAGFATNVAVANQAYAFTIDSSNVNCVWTNGNTGAIANFDGTTGQLGCPVSTTKAAVDFVGLPKFSCNVTTGTIRNFYSLEVTMPQGSTFNSSNLVVSVLNGQGTPVTGFQSIPVVNGAVSLTGLNVTDTSTEFRFVIQSVNNSTYPLSNQDAGAIAARLVYEADPVQLCVQLSAVTTLCPANATGPTVSQPDLVVTATSSYTISGSAAVSQSDTSTYHVNAVPVLQCYIWQTFLNSAGQGVDTGGAAGMVSTVVFGPDNKMYVGGVFTNSGGDANADYLAVWDGSAWKNVGQVPVMSNGQPVLDQQGNQTYGPALNGRVNSIAWTADNKLLVGGAFTDAAGIATADYLALYDPIAKTWSAPATALDGAVTSITMGANGVAYLGGAFTGKVTAINTSNMATVTVPTLGANASVVYATSTGTVYAGGLFSGYIKKLDASGANWVDVSTDPNQSNFITGAVYGITVAAGKLYAVGAFNGVAVLDLTAGTWSWLSGAAALDGQSRSVAVGTDGRVWVAGSFTLAGSVAAIDAAMYDGTTWVGFRDARTLSMAMDVAGSIGPWTGAWTVVLSPRGVPIWGGDIHNCATRADLDYLCYFGDRIDVSPAAFNVSTPLPHYDGPMVTWQSTYTEAVEGGHTLTIKGRMIAKTNSVLIGGKPAKIVSTSDDTVVVIMPDNLEGPQTLKLSMSDNALVYYSTITYKKAAVVATPVKRPPVTVTIGGFPDGSPVLTRTIKNKINAFLKKYSDYSNIECVGYTEGPTVLKTDAKLSKQRAVNSCAFAQAGLAKGMKLVGTRAGQDTKEAAALRRVVITLTDN